MPRNSGELEEARIQSGGFTVGGRAPLPTVIPPPPPRKIGRDPIVENVRKKLLGRSDFGLAKYGIGLDREDLDLYAWLNHLQEELMDATNYVERTMQELGKHTSFKMPEPPKPNYWMIVYHVIACLCIVYMLVNLFNRVL